MARSLDGLIRHLLDQIALCGEHGALPSDFVSYVKGYYAEQSEGTQHVNGDGIISSQKVTPNIDRPFLEHVWKWITRNPEIRVGDHAAHKRLTLSEVEARNANTRQQDQSLPSAAAPALKDEVGSQNNYSHKAGKATKLVSGDDSLQSSQPTIAAGVPGSPKTLSTSRKSQKLAGSRPNSKPSKPNKALKSPITPAKHLKSLPISTSQPGIRLYTSENRMWYALTGHGPDLSKIKALDFVALSIIAACGPTGILQHDLTRVSGQDKRSLPARTDRLHHSGYIVKERLVTDDGTGQRMIHTSRCTLARYAKTTPIQVERPADPLTKQERRREQKRKRKGKNLAASSDATSSTTPTLNVNPNPAPPHLRTHFVPQWTSDRSVNNNIYDLVDQAGTQGMSMNELRGRLFGESVKKVTEDYVSRLVECWQLSQPLHLRHLSIVRDTLLRGKSQIYVYYTYKNFKKLVEAGTGFWEAVTTVPETVRQGNNVAASLSEEPDVDEYGFPKLDANQFQGRHNDATLGECISALNASSFRLSANDPFLQKRMDGTSVLKYKPSGKKNGDEPRPRMLADSPAQLVAQKPLAIDISTGSTFLAKHETMEPHLTNTERKTPHSPTRHGSEDFRTPKKFVYLTTQVDPARAEGYDSQSKRPVARKTGKRTGRPRKYPKSGIPVNIETMTPSEIKKLRDSQEMAEKYERNKIDYEITERVKDGEDPVFVTQEVLDAADILRKRDGREPLPSFPRAQILHQFAGGPTPKPIESATGDLESVLPSSHLLPRGGTNRRRKKSYWPSMAAHTIWTPSPSKNSNTKVRSEKASRDVKNLSARIRNQEHHHPAIVAQKAILEAKPDHPYHPSVAAHSWPHSFHAVSKIEASQTKRPRGRPRKVDKRTILTLSINQRAVSSSLETCEQTVSQYKYLPSLAAHFGSLLFPIPSSRIAEPPKKPTAHNEIIKAPLSPSMLLHSPPQTPLKAATVDPPHSNCELIISGSYPGWIEFMSKYYQGQLDTIARPHDGVFFGPTKPRRKRRYEPPDLRPREYKVVIFRLAGLRKLAWFVAKTRDSEEVPSLDKRELDPLALVVDPESLEPRQTPTDFTHDMSPSLTETEARSRTSPKPSPDNLRLQPEPNLPQSPFVDQIVPKAASGYVSPYADKIGVKRKRGDSPQPTRGTPPPPPGHLRDSYGENPEPEAQNLIVVVSNGAHARADRNSEDVCQASDEAILEAPEAGERISNDRSKAPITDRPICGPSLGTAPADDSVTIQQSASNEISDPTSILKRSSFDMEIVEPQVEKTFNRMSRLGGSVAMLRKKIVMDLVEKCDGVFSGHGEMVVPFTIEWSKRGLEGNPEKRTVQNAVNNLCAEGKLRRIMFTYQNKHGIVATKTMFTLAHIDPADPRVKEMRARMIAYHPRYYVPEAVMPAEDQESLSVQHTNSLAENEDPSRATEDKKRTASKTSPADSRRLKWGRNMTKGKDRVVEFRLEALRAQERGEMQHPDISRTDGASQSDGDPKVRPRMLYIPPELPPKLVGRRRGSIEDVQRQSSLDRTPDEANEAIEPPFPLPKRTSAAGDGTGSLTWLSSEYAFSEFNFEDQRPTLLKPTTSKTIRSAYARYGSRLDLSSPISSLFRSGNQPSQRMREITENAKRIERVQKEAKATRPSLLSSDPQSSPLKSLYARSRPLAPENLKSRAKSKDKGQDRTTHEKDWSTPVGGSERSELTKTLQSSDGAHSESVEQPEISTMQDMQPDRKRRLLVSFMDPVHHFNSSTGTFWVSFSGLVRPSKHVTCRGTASSPHTHVLRPVAPLMRKRKRLAGVLSLKELSPISTGRFEDDINELLESELSVGDLQDAAFPDWPMINYVFPHPHTTVESMGVGANDYNEPTEFGRPIKKRKYVRSRIGHSVLNKGKKDISPAAAEALQKIQWRAPLKRRRLTSLTANRDQDDASSPAHLGSDSRPTKFRRVRGPRGTNSMGEEGEKRLLTAVVAIRTLTGGLEQHIDWVLVAKAFEGTHEQMFLHSRWGHVREKNRLLMPKLEKDFQASFPKAYEEGKVPSIDFENLVTYDWKALVDWTLNSLSADLQGRPDLPADRHGFDNDYTLDEAPEEDMSGFYEIDAPLNIAKRTSIVNCGAYSYPSKPRTRLSQREEKEQIATAKTWVRANVITPEETYDGEIARDKLSIFPLRVIEDALKELLIDRVLMQENKGRLIPGRNYDISEYLISRLKKNLLPAHFRRALAYKKQLDLDFEETGSALYSLTADDGDVLAIINMVAEKRINLSPISIPAKKWGLLDGSYETRQMDKRLLSFDVELRPLPAYVEGIPLSPFPPPPCSHLQDPRAKIPLWYDIHDRFVPVMWEMALAAILAISAIRSGIGVKELERAVRPAMDLWEIDLILEWLVCAKAARRVGGGYAVDEWWWLALGSAEVGGAACLSPSREKGKGRVED